VGQGPLYQGRFRSFPIQQDEHLLTVMRYVEANPLRAGLVQRAEAWRWDSLRVRLLGSAQQQALLSPSPVALPGNWTPVVNRPTPAPELETVRHSIIRSAHLGQKRWVDRVARALGLEATQRRRGRPKKRTTLVAVARNAT